MARRWRGTGGATQPRVDPWDQDYLASRTALKGRAAQTRVELWEQE